MNLKSLCLIKAPGCMEMQFKRTLETSIEWVVPPKAPQECVIPWLCPWKGADKITFPACRWTYILAPFPFNGQDEKSSDEYGIDDVIPIVIEKIDAYTFAMPWKSDPNALTMAQILSVVVKWEKEGGPEVSERRKEVFARFGSSVDELVKKCNDGATKETITADELNDMLVMMDLLSRDARVSSPVFRRHRSSSVGGLIVGDGKSVGTRDFAKRGSQTSQLNPMARLHLIGANGLQPGVEHGSHTSQLDPAAAATPLVADPLAVSKVAVAAFPDVTTDGSNPLYSAAKKGHVKIVEKLIAASADVDKAETTHGYTPLYIAAHNGHIEVVEKLIAASADVDKARTTTHGRTPLYIAARNGHVEIVDKLIAASADVEKGKYTPLQVAQQKGHSIVALLLRDAVRPEAEHKWEQHWSAENRAIMWQHEDTFEQTNECPKGVMQLQMRVAPDRHRYTKDQFTAFYGGTVEWDESISSAI